jgi:HAD superfamily hydrolase (TIGR01509 family)
MKRYRQPLRPPSTCQAVVFDFDGTLFDTTRAIVHSFQRALQQRGWAPVPAHQIRTLIGRPLYEMFPRLLPGLTESEVAELIRLYREAFTPVCVSLSKPMPGLRACVQALFEHRLHLAIVTSRLVDGARRILCGFGLEERFVTIVGLEDVRHPKPDPEPVLVALDRLGVHASEAVGVGDTVDDLRAYQAAGVFPIAFAPRQSDVHRRNLHSVGPVVVLRRLNELPAVLGLRGRRFTDRRRS